MLVACSIAFALLLPIVWEYFKGARGGWGDLARAYATTEKPTGETWRRQSIVAGLILYRFCVTVGIDRPGLYLAVMTSASAASAAATPHPLERVPECRAREALLA